MYLLFQHEDSTRNERMGCLQGPSYQGDLGFHGEPKMSRDIRQDTESLCVFDHLSHSPGIRSDSQRNSFIYDFAT